MSDLTAISTEHRPETRMGARGGYPSKLRGNQRDPLSAHRNVCRSGSTTTVKKKLAEVG